MQVLSLHSEGADGERLHSTFGTQNRNQYNFLVYGYSIQWEIKEKIISDFKKSMSVTYGKLPSEDEGRPNLAS